MPLPGDDEQARRCGEQEPAGPGWRYKRYDSQDNKVKHGNGNDRQNKRVKNRHFHQNGPPLALRLSEGLGRAPSRLILADIKRAMKHTEDIDIAASPNQLGDSVISVQQYPHMPRRSPVPCAHLREVRQSLRLPVYPFHGSYRSSRIFCSNVVVDIAQPALSFGGPNYPCHCLILRPISSSETTRPASESASPR